MKKFKVLIIGGVAAGASAATRMRRLSEYSEIILIEKGKEISYANCGMPYFLGGVISERENLLVETAAGLRRRFNIDVRTENIALSINPKKKNVLIKNLKTGHFYHERYDKLILATGSTAFVPNIPGIDSAPVFTLKDLIDCDKINQHLNKRTSKKAVILGGGPIGVELAENLIQRGVGVSIVEMGNHIISPLDLDMARLVENHLAEKGVVLFLGKTVAKISKKGSGAVVTLQDGKELEADLVIVVAGVRPESKLAKEAGLLVGPNGAIEVNEFLYTSNPNILAVGDAISIKEEVSGIKGLIALAGPANKQGRLAAENALGAQKTYNGAIGSGVLKAFDLTVAMTGLSEEALAKLGKPSKSTIIHVSNHAGYYPGASPLSLKLIFGPKGKILGAQAVGYSGVEKRIDIIATAIKARQSVSFLSSLDLCYAPPYSSAKDPVNLVGFSAQNILEGQIRPFYSQEVVSLHEKDIFLLDVRTKLEYEQGHLEGAVNIPLDTLRAHLHRLPKKEFFVYCATGLRSYIACRILQQAGFRCYNLVGGFKTYTAINAPKADSTNLTCEEVMKIEIDGAASELPKVVATTEINACGLMCPGPLEKVFKASKKLKAGDVLRVKATDPAFKSDIKSWCDRTGNTLISITQNKEFIEAEIQMGKGEHLEINHSEGNAKTLVIFSDEIDRVIASFIIANGAAAMGREVTMFFTFWGLNVIRKQGSVPQKKDVISRAFGLMMPKGSKHLHLSQLNMGGAGAALIRWLMVRKNIGTLEDLMKKAQDAGVKLIACSTSMEIMGIKKEELIDGVEIGGVGTYLGEAEKADTNLFI